MASVTVHRVDSPEPEVPTGEHVWLVVEFTSGVMVNVRVDEFENADAGGFHPVARLKVGRNSGWVREREVRL